MKPGESVQENFNRVSVVFTRLLSARPANIDLAQTVFQPQPMTTVENMQVTKAEGIDAADQFFLTQLFIAGTSMQDMTECIAKIGKSGSGIFTTINLTTGFWQIILHPKSCPYTAFMVPGQGQYQWVTSPMGLLRFPASFQRLMETIVKGVPNLLVYIDDLLFTHTLMLNIYAYWINSCVCLQGMKITLEKCALASP
jgi:hypothetical protein